MHVKTTAVLIGFAVALALPSSALADYGHITQPGESLSSIAALDGLSLNALAATNGLSPAGELRVGQIVEIPPLDAATAVAAAPQVPATAVSTSAPTTTSSTGFVGESARAAAGSYVVRLGDTLSGIAARLGTSVSALATLNGINPGGVLEAGRILTVPGQVAAAPTETESGTAVGAPATGPGNQQIAGDTTDGPYPTDQDVTSSQVGQEAENGNVSPSLAEAIGYQESGFDNDVVSGAGAVGVMQIEPATWSWINSVLTPGAPLDPASAYDNVAGGVDLLRDLIAQTGSDTEATAAYYQGLASLHEHGMYPSTQQYVADVQALENRFGG